MLNDRSPSAYRELSDWYVNFLGEFTCAAKSYSATTYWTFGATFGFGFNGGGGGGALFDAAADAAPPEGVYGGGGAAAEPGIGGGVFLTKELEGTRPGGGVREVAELPLAALTDEAVVPDRLRLLPSF